MEAESTADHIKWVCKHFKAKREELDKDLAQIPVECLPLNVRSGIAPAMKAEGKATYWGRNLGSEISERVKTLLGYDDTLKKPGKNADVTRAREAAIEILEDPQAKGYNARQILLKQKEAHGAGVNLTFPDADGINEHMNGYEDQEFIEIYGDGSLKNPRNWWAALGGRGVWIPEWNKPGEKSEQRSEAEYAIPRLGQTSTSTREELAAWLIALTIPIRSNYATDNKRVVGKATEIINAAIRQESNLRDGKGRPDKYPLGKAWGLQTDGDLWQQVWEAVVKRGACNQTIRWVKRPCYR